MTPRSKWFCGMCGGYLYGARNLRGVVRSKEIWFSNVNGILQAEVKSEDTV